MLKREDVEQMAAATGASIVWHRPDRRQYRLAIPRRTDVIAPVPSAPDSFYAHEQSNARPPVPVFYVFGHKVTYLFDEAILVDPGSGLPITITDFVLDTADGGIRRVSHVIHVRSGQIRSRPAGTHHVVGFPRDIQAHIRQDASSTELEASFGLIFEKDFVHP